MTISMLSLYRLPSLGRCNSYQVQGGLNAAFQDLLCLRSIGHSPCELKGAHHEAEDGGRAAAARSCICVRKQRGQCCNVASQPFLVVFPGGQGLSGDFGEQCRRGAPARRVFEVSAVQVSPNRALKVQAPPVILIEAMLLVAERARQRLANERVFGLEVRRECALGQAGSRP
ncbi:hypothetical protein ACVW0J_007328 [Bradyrhizobium sp. i1.7.7]